jgi:hypothetical protein
MKHWAGNVWAAIKVWLYQTLVSFDQAFGNLLLGFLKVLSAIFTGRRQSPIWSDETLSAHCFRSARAGKQPALYFIVLVDWFFSWQKEDAGVNAAAGRRITSHCERAYWKEKLRRGLPPEERGI